MTISSREKKLLVVSVLAIALPLSIGLVGNRINATPKVNIPPYPSLPNPNGYDLYVAAATAMTPANPAVDAVNDGKRPDDPKMWPQKYSLARKTAWLNGNAKAFSLFDRAMKTPTLAPPNRSFGVSFPSYAQLRELARCKAIESNARWLRQDYYGALNSGIDTIQMGHDMRRGGRLLAALVGIAIGAIGRDRTHDTVEHLDAAQAKAAARRVENLLDTRWNLAQVLAEEKYGTQTSMMETFRSSGWRRALMGSKLTLAQRVRGYTISQQQIIDDIGLFYDREIASVQRPYLQRGAPQPELNDPFLKVLVVSSGRARNNEARDLAGDRLLMLRLALRAYRLENGAYPLQLNDLVPKYLTAIPADPYGNGEAMHYKSDGKTHTLWSIGPDGKDNGGTPVPFRPGTRLPAPSPDGRPWLPQVNLNSTGDIVAGKNR